MSKHAYLILANENFNQLVLLLEMLDYAENDLFLHIDSKTGSYDSEALRKVVVKGRLFILDRRICVNWGGYSMIEAELLLLQTAIDTDQYEYYHLLSGKDMPLKTQEEIHLFFEENKGKEFLRIGKHTTSNYEFRYKYYHKWVEKGIKNPKSKLTELRMILDIIRQRLLGVNRTKENTSVDFRKGTQWFSITDSLARYVLSRKDWIKKTFEDTYCCDEVFLQTLVQNSDFKKQLYYREGDTISCNMRKIDWNRGRPYTFCIEDKQEILDSYCLFIRKIDEKADSQLAAFLHDRILHK